MRTPFCIFLGLERSLLHHNKMCYNYSLSNLHLSADRLRRREREGCCLTYLSYPWNSSQIWRLVYFAKKEKRKKSLLNGWINELVEHEAKLILAFRISSKVSHMAYIPLQPCLIPSPLGSSHRKLLVSPIIPPSPRLCTFSSFCLECAPYCNQSYASEWLSIFQLVAKWLPMESFLDT